MTIFQVVLLLAAVGIFVLFFRQLLSGNYPRRGVDYEQKTPQERIGTINRPDRTFAGEKAVDERSGPWLAEADEALKRGDNLEAKRLLQKALIVKRDDPEILRRLGTVYMRMNDFGDARRIYEMLLDLDPSDDLAHASLANALHKLGEDEEAIRHHEESIRLDPDYAPHHYNYANTLYDLGRKEEALARYRRALELDPKLTEARDMIEELSR